ncbi:hypothetical protein [Clostridium sp.]|uniref:hypothetical protein n=1 Tax=Clostridium sp. TaxID=1506 RepID=UPI003D6D33C9
MNNNKRFFKKFVILAFIIWVAILIRIPGLPFMSGDYNSFVSKWFDTIKADGGFIALKNAMGDYTQPYLYLLTIGTYTNINTLFYVKMLSFVFELITALYIMKIVNIKYKNEKLDYLSFGLVLIIPTVIFNGSVWAQCDIIFTAFVIGSIYYILCEKPVTSIIFYGIALSFKLQAIFLLPLFGILLFKKKIKIYHLLLIPISYLVINIPSLIVGKPLKDILLTYATQSGEYKNLTYNAPSIYQWIPSKLFSDTTLVGYIGILFTFAVVLIILFVSVKYIKVIKYENVIELSLLLAVIVPFLLPRMHERYFFMADVISLLYAFCFPKKFYIAIIIPLVSLLCYLPFLYNTGTDSIIDLSIVLFIVIIDLLYSFRLHLINEKKELPSK